MNFLTGLLSSIIMKLLDKLIVYVKEWFSRKKEQEDRHGETTTKVEDYKESKDETAKDDFSKLP